jgi:hypothetical protein
MATAVMVYVPSVNGRVICQAPEALIVEVPSIVVPRITLTVPPTSVDAIVPVIVIVVFEVKELFVGAVIFGAGGGVRSFIKFSTDQPVIPLSHFTCHHQYPSMRIGPPTTVPFVVFTGIIPINVPVSEGVALTLRFAVVPTRSPITNLVDFMLDGGAGGGVGATVAFSSHGSIDQPVKLPV